MWIFVMDYYMYSVCHKKHNKTQQIKLVKMLSFLIDSIKYARFMYGHDIIHIAAISTDTFM